MSEQKNHATPRPQEVMFLGFKPKEMPAFPSYQQYSGENRLLSPPECRAIIEAAERKQLRYGTVGNGTNVGDRDDPEYRSVSVCGLEPGDCDASGQDLRWLYMRVAQRVHWANEHWRFQISGFNESFQYLRYESHNKDNRPPGHYKMHQDFGGGYSSLRKLSVVIQLSDPSEYEGCRLSIVDNQIRELPEIGQGDMIIFPSWTPHFVSPITNGVRHALALWVTGEQFR